MYGFLYSSPSTFLAPCALTCKIVRCSQPKIAEAKWKGNRKKGKAESREKRHLGTQPLPPPVPGTAPRFHSPHDPPLLSRVLTYLVFVFCLKFLFLINWGGEREMRAVGGLWFHNTSGTLIFFFLNRKTSIEYAFKAWGK